MNHLFDIFLPRRCVYCRNPIANLYFCLPCESKIRSSKTTSSHPAHSLFSYESIIRELLLRAKFAPDFCTGVVLANYFGERLASPQASLSVIEQKYDYVTYVPSHFHRRIYRGYELTAQFAKQVAKITQSPLRSMLRSTRNDPPLSRTSCATQRIELVRGRFTIRAAKKSPMKILLIDDIVTTGATIKEACRTLEEQGHEVECLVFAQKNPQ